MSKLVACVLFSGALLTAMTAQADRRTGMSGSLLIEDQDDVFIFPQYMAKYPNQIWLDYGPMSDSGNAILTLGDENSAFGLAIHRGDAQGPHQLNTLYAINGQTALFGPANPFAGFDPSISVEPATIVDLLYGTGSFGLRASIGRGSQVTTAADMDTGEADFFAMIEGGFGSGVRGETTRFDLSGALTLDFGAAVANNTDVASGTQLGLSLLGRAFIPVDGTMDLGILGNARVGSTSVSDDQAPDENSDSLLNFGLGGGIGPAFRLGAANVAGYATLRFDYANRDPDSEADDDSTSTIGLVVPGVHMAVEVPVTDWFYVRSGAEYAFIYESDSAPADSGSSSSTGDFGWNAGIGVKVDDFRFDGALQQGFVTGGPNFLSGTSNPLFAMASLTYNFDGLRSGATPPEPAEEPEPELEPEPAYEPTPAPAPAPEPAPATGDAAADGDVEGSVSGEAEGSIGIGTPTPAPAPAPAPTPPAPVE